MRLRYLLAPAAALLLAACSTSTTSPATPSSGAPEPTRTALPSESGSPIGGNVLPPIEIDGQSSETVKVGDHLNVTSDGVTKVSTDNAEVLKVSQPHTEGQATFNGGAEVVGAGTATLVVSGKGGELYSTKITATQ